MMAVLMMSRGIFLTIYYLSKGQLRQTVSNYCVWRFSNRRLIVFGKVLIGFNKCPGVIFQKLVCPGGILRFALPWEGDSPL